MPSPSIQLMSPLKTGSRCCFQHLAKQRRQPKSSWPLLTQKQRIPPTISLCFKMAIVLVHGKERYTDFVKNWSVFLCASFAFKQNVTNLGDQGWGAGVGRSAIIWAFSKPAWSSPRFCHVLSSSQQVEEREHRKVTVNILKFRPGKGRRHFP